MQIREHPKAIYFLSKCHLCFNSADEKEIRSYIQFDVITTSLPVEVLLYIKSFSEQSRIILLLPYKILERFFDK